MINKKEKVLPLSLALRAAVYAKDDQSLISRIAEKNCWNLTTFRNSLCPTTTTHKANIHHFEAVLNETRDSGIMDSVCAIHGNAAWFELPLLENLSKSDFIMKIGKLAQEQGDLSLSIANAIGDGVISSDELAVIQKDVMDLIRVASSLMAMVQHQHELGA
ncbi:Rha family transcriptional regulator [Acinetobacter sp. ANC 4204]|uniref:Rha family transcriptional regulator n=1 Tax=Acinetobacter johnsonii TaxID=40214 RepID=A0A3R9G1J9_ACIJO|nr:MULTISPECIES: phage regulatory CII family protein [Acinetobacter]OTG58892.1 Rha family transcriptional regulator [Acinetobacter sp. ANC 4204]RSE21251.1 Rha family transcriptional regulator [Acinetobacter johnsonii]